MGPAGATAQTLRSYSAVVPSARAAKGRVAAPPRPAPHPGSAFNRARVKARAQSAAVRPCLPDRSQRAGTGGVGA